MRGQEGGGPVRRAFGPGGPGLRGLDPRLRALGASRARIAAPLLTAGALAALALLTVKQAGCDEPARYVPVAGGYELVGGCLAPEDLLVQLPPAQSVQHPPSLPAPIPPSRG